LLICRVNFERGILKKMMQSQRKKSVVVIGSGNVAWHLAPALHKAGWQVAEVCSRTLSQAEELAGRFRATASDECAEIKPDADFYLLAVPDAKITAVAEAMPAVSGVVCHTSGITPVQVLNRFKNFGVFYPLQTFSKNKPVDLQEVPFCLEASSQEIYSILETLAGQLSRRVYSVSSEQRMKLHLAAVWVNNFTNHLFAQAQSYLEENGLDKELLYPLMRETVDKLQYLPASEAQTGPARRGDRTTLSKHLKMLEDHAELKEVYQLFSRQILKKYHE
jgi:predicted short-subunit dehydrogenase-like oxidoreductase (DUF2520 family)